MIESEKLLEKKLKLKVKEKLGGWCLKFLPLHINGMPDRLCLIPYGKAIFVEVKTTGKKPSKLQKLIHKKLKKLGFPVILIDSTQAINKLIKNYETK